MASNPMYQFNVYRIGPEIKLGEVDLSFTNASLFMVFSSLAVLIIFNLGSKKNSLIPNKIQLLAELSYTFVSKMISDTAGSKAKPYRPAQTTRYDDKQRLNSNIYPMCQDTRAKTFTENLGANLPNEARRYKSQQMVTNNVVLKSSHRQVH